MLPKRLVDPRRLVDDADICYGSAMGLQRVKFAKRCAIGAVSIGLVFALTSPALGQQSRIASGDYPNKPIRLLVPSAAGSGTDLVGRMLAQELSETWGQSVVVDNRGGAGGIPAVALVSKTAPDGYTMLLGSIGHFSFAPVLYRKLPYDPQRDLTYISLVADQPFVITVHPSVAASSMKEFINYAKARPGGLSYGSGGGGTAPHLGTELLQLMAGISMAHVAYRGVGPGMIAVMSGEIHFLMVGVANALPHIKSSKVKAIATTGTKRARVLPDLPTVAEGGLSEFDFNVWYGLVFPGGMKRSILTKANAEIAKILTSPAVYERFAAIGLEPRSSTPDEFTLLLKNEAPRWEKVVTAAKIRVE